MSREKRIGKLSIEINPELISICSKKKKLDVCAIWLVLRTIDRHKQGTGKITQSSCLDIIQEMLKCNQNYSYEIMKKGIGYFWNEPTGAKGSKIIYLFGIDKVVNTLSFELSKTQPFLIKVEDLFKFDTAAELKTFLCSFVIARYGQNKPITVKSLEHNLGLSSSTIKRRINTSDNLTIRKNYCQTEKFFDTIADAYSHLKYSLKTEPEKFKAFKIIKKDNKYCLVKQMGNSYSCEDFSRGKISRRPKAFKIIDRENRETLESKKYYYVKSKKSIDNNLIYAKTKSNFEDYHLWTQSCIDQLDLPDKKQIAIARGRWRKNKECI